MDQKYRLKKEVRKHFKLSDRQAIRTLDKWNERFIGEEVLDKVEKVYVEYAESKTYYGHNFDAKFDFSVIITDCSESQWRDMDIAPILDEMQAVLNSHYSK